VESIKTQQMVQPFDFTGQTAVVTGGAGILDGEMAYALVKHGAAEIAGDNASCESSDQRGKSRPFDGDNTPVPCKNPIPRIFL
jgi:NAD(P)-dependent dehydrogenase (short-subunit alcohol dehydrogenase family)